MKEMEKEDLNIEKRLERLKNENLFKVPENYFEEFSGRLKSRIAGESKSEVRLLWTGKYLKQVLGIAAVIAILFLAVYIPVRESFKDEKILTFNKKPVNINNTASGNEQQDMEALMMMPQSQFLSALEAADTSEDTQIIDPQALKDYLTENSLDYYLLTSN
jgi:hypothetical protein